LTRTELADVNVLVAVALEGHDDHETAIRWLRETPAFATTPLTEVGLVRLLLNTSVVGRPVRMEEALTTLRSIKALRTASFLPDSSSLTDHRAFTSHVTRTRQVIDTHLLNLAIAAGHTLVTFDGRFHGSLSAQARKHVRILG
jgi:toxin-antitoxin system PIN domain toxin